jgi:RNase H-fold protein (predicted Holliday junction resolvase)
MDQNGKKAKLFLLEQFDSGAATGLKADPAQVSREMKQVKDKNGKPLFKPEEWRTAQQIKSFFSRMSSKRKQQQREEIELSDEDLEALEAEESLEDLRNVSQDMNVPSHPVTAGKRNLCQLSS